MNKILIFFLTMSFCSIKTNAQVQRNADPSQNVATTSDKKTEKLQMMKSLDLSKQQMGELKEFHREQKQKKDGILNDQSLTDAQRQEKLKDLHKEQKEKLNSILTPEQMDKLKQERMNNKKQKQSINSMGNTGLTQ